MSFNLDKFKAILADPNNYAPLAALRSLDNNDPRITSAYGDAVQFLADTPELQELYFSVEYQEKMQLVELLAAGISAKQLRDEMEARPWAHEKEIAAERARAQKLAPAQFTKPKWSRFAQKKPLSKWEISQSQKSGAKGE